MRKRKVKRYGTYLSLAAAAALLFVGWGSKIVVIRDGR